MLQSMSIQSLNGYTGVRDMKEGENRNKPDIVLFMADQLSAKWLEGQSHKACPTPNLDYLRHNGVSFSNAITSNPVCSPARATILTGLGSRNHGVIQNGYTLDDSLPNFVKELQSNGWKTGAFGKVHVHPHFATVYPDYRPYGFDVTTITQDPRAGEWLDWVEREHPEHFRAALATIWTLELPELREYGPYRVNLQDRARKIRQGFVWRTEAFPNNNAAMHTLPFPESLSQSSWITNNAVRFIESTDPQTPLFAHVSYVQPHPPNNPPARFMGEIDTSSIPTPVAPEWPDDASRPACFPEGDSPNATIPSDWNLRRHYYFADIACVDFNIGVVLDALRKRGSLENTLIIFLSDHGELLMDHGFHGKGNKHYDACIRVPLIISGPGIKKDSQCANIVQLEDIAPTVLEMAKITPKPGTVQGSISDGTWDEPETRTTRDERVPAFSGKSLVPFCSRPDDSQGRTSAYAESYGNIHSLSPMGWARTVRTHNWRYTFYPCDGGSQLFDLRNDPNETHNLARDPGYRNRRRELEHELLNLMVLQDYPYPPRGLHGLKEY